MTNRIISLFSLLFLLSCNIHHVEVKSDGNGAYIVPIYKDTTPPPVFNQKHRRPTTKEYEELFTYPKIFEEGHFYFQIGEEELEIPLQGFSPTEGQVSLFHKWGSYWTDEEVLFQMDEKGAHRISDDTEGYHSLRYVSETICEDCIKVGDVYWFKQNMGEENKKISFYNKDTVRVSYQSLTGLN